MTHDLSCHIDGTRHTIAPMADQAQAALSDKVGPIVMAAAAVCITLLELLGDRMA